MTLKTEVPISIDHKIHRVYHQHYHHHHYHLHHILEHHHLHIHNQSVSRSHVLSQQSNQPRLQQLQQQPPPPQQLQQRNQLQLAQQQHQQRLENGAEPGVVARQLPAPATPALLDSQHDRDGDLLSGRLRVSRSDAWQHQRLAHSRGLTHLIGPQGYHHDRERPIVDSSTHVTKNSRDTASPKSKQRSQIQFLLLSAFAYILSPIDIIPEAIFGVFGILDDLVFLIMCLFCVAIILLYPLFREMRRTLFDKLGLKQHCAESAKNKKI